MSSFKNVELEKMIGERIRIRIKKPQLVLILVAVALLSILFSLLAFKYLAPEVDVIDIEVGIGPDNEVGFAVDSKMLNFGTIPKNSTSYRTVVIKSTEDKKIYLLVDGIDFVYLDKNEFDIKKDEVKEIRVYASAPESMEYGKYRGKLKIISERI